MSENQKIKVEPFRDDYNEVESVDYIANNIKEEPEVEFVLILPPRQMKVEKVEILNDHKQKETNEKNKQCQKFPKLFVNQHEQTHKPKAKCNFCLKLFAQGSLKTHLKMHENAKEFNCDHCAAGFVTKYHLCQHLLIHQTDKPFNCSKCNLSFNYKQNFKVHLLAHSKNPRPFQCDLCPKNYAVKQELGNHLIAIHSEQTLKCDECKFTTKRKANVLRHKKKMHSNNVKLLSCPICEKMFKTKQEVQKHQVVHKAEKDIECNTCGKMFGSQRNLQRHIKNIHGESFFKVQKYETNFFAIIDAIEKFCCSQFPQAFKAKDSLKRHEKTH
jgi:KRAB domain-containing zinc finger protein